MSPLQTINAETRNRVSWKVVVSMEMAKGNLHPDFAEVLQSSGVCDADGIFASPKVRPWRVIAERDNCVFDTFRAGQPLRFHIKRFKTRASGETPAELEVKGISLLQRFGVPTVSLAGWGVFKDGRSFIAVEDLSGWVSAANLLARGVSFETLLPHLVSICSLLHRALHHQDLYLCHIFVNPNTFETRLIDAGRVRMLPGNPLRYKWIVKDLAQLCYSAQEAGVRNSNIQELLSRYFEAGDLACRMLVRWGVAIKSAKIRRHARKLDLTSPERNVSIPA